MPLKFCANLNFLFAENGAGVLEKYRLAKLAGFKGVETGYPEGNTPEEVVKVKNETGMEQVLLNICTDGSEDMKFGCASFPNAEKQFKKNLELSIKLAKQLNCNKIHVMAGKCKDEPTSENYDTYLSNLKYAAKMFESAKIIGVIEPINKYAVPNYYLNNYKTATDILNAVNSPHLRLMVDIFHLQHIQGNVTHTLNDLMPYIGHIQIAQVPNRHEPNVPGELNFSYIFKALEDAGYSGWIGCEYKPKTKTEDGLTWIQEFGYKL